MVALAAGAIALLLGLWLLRLFANARAETVRKVLVWSGATLGGALLLAMLVTGRGLQALWALAFFAPMLWRHVRPWFSRWRFNGQPQAQTEHGETAVETATLAMRLEHRTGEMSGRVRRGRHLGRELAEMPLVALLDLLAECRANDPESVPLLEAWLDRAAPDWRVEEAAGAHHAPGAPPGAKMSRADALGVLGLSEGASEAQVRAAHRKLMQAAHPDRGGSDWLAARVNEARDVLLGGR